MNSENESIRANPASSTERHIRQSGSFPNLRNGVASPERSQLTKQHGLGSAVDSAVAPHESLALIGLSKLRGPPVQPVPMQLSPQTALQGDHPATSTDASSPGTPQQPDTAQLSTDLLTAWAQSNTFPQHESLPTKEIGPLSSDADGLDQPEDGPSDNGRQSPDLACWDATPQQQRGVASASAQHDTPDGALVADTVTPDHPSSGKMRISHPPIDAKDVLSEVCSTQPFFPLPHLHHPIL